MTKTRQSLNTKQTEILIILYKFRFATRDLIVNYQQLKSKTYTQYRLTNLLEQEYIARKYSGKDKINGKPAIYYLSNRGIRFLLSQSKLNLNPKVLNSVYKDKIASDKFIDQSLDIFKIYNNFQRKYGNKLDFYTKSETNEYDYFIYPRPDAYITIKNQIYFLQLIYPDTPYFAIRRRINQYIKQYSSDTWQNSLSSNYPIVLIACPNSRTEAYLQTHISKLLDNMGINELNIYTTTQKAIVSPHNAEKAIWSNVLKSENPISL